MPVRLPAVRREAHREPAIAIGAEDAELKPVGPAHGVRVLCNGHVDLRHSVPDVLASSANLLREGGWQAGEPWLEEVRVPREMDWQEADLNYKGGKRGANRLVFSRAGQRFVSVLIKLEN